MNEPDKDHHDKMMRYSRGWMNAAGCQPIPEEMQADPDYLEGWNNGREAKRRAMKDAEIKYGARFSLIKIAEAKGGA